MIRRLALTAGFAILGTVAFASNAQAQTQNGSASETIPFSGSVGSACTFSETQAGILEAPGSSTFVSGNVGVFSAGNGTAGETTVNCTNGGSLTVAQPNPINVPPGFNPAVTQAIVATETDKAPYLSSPGPRFDGGSWSQTIPTLDIEAATDLTLKVAMIAGERGGPVIPSGNYEYEVVLTATPN